MNFPKNSPSHERLLSVGSALFFWLTALAVLIKALSVKIYDPDLWWHLAAGRAIVEGRSFLRHDIFSHTFYGAEWINFEWLSQVLLYLGWKFFGIGAAFYGKILLSLAVVAIAGLVLHRTGLRHGPLFAACWLGYLALRPRLYERVELATLIMMGLFVLLILTARTSDRGFQRKIPWIFFGLTALWSNFHGGFIYGAGLVVLFALGARWAKEPASYGRLLSKSAVLVGAGAFLNMNGTKLAGVFAAHLKQLHDQPGVIAEWASPSLENQPYFWILFLLSACGLVRGFLQGDRRVRFWSLPVLVFAVWGSVSYRNASLFAFVALPFVAESLLKPLWTKWTSRFSKALVAVNALCFIVPLLLHAHSLAKPWPEGYVNGTRFPQGACEFMKRNGLSGALYNSYEFGGYIEWALGPGTKVFMDGRYIFHPLLVEQLPLLNPPSIERGVDGWNRYFGRYGVDAALVNYSDSALNFAEDSPPFSISVLNIMFPRAQWALVYWDDAALLFLKRTPLQDPFIRTHEYRSLWPHNLSQMDYVLASNEIAPREALLELERHQRDVRFSFRAQEIKRLIDQRSAAGL